MQQLVEGQIWTYHHRSKDDSTSRFTIYKIDQMGDHDVVHIKISGVRFAGKKMQIQHMPFTRESIEQSVIELVGNIDDLKDEHFTDGYENWKKESLEGRAGAWTMNVDKAIDLLEKATTGADE
ncbi:predicted protein [Naegleria gruberi]|uniref:Predicted protein n=1 Tax=Naegleria gruberi TaxID=5762 RepID=D2VJ12_NAEGR|nr:uncharacterized protein NAEGRDRAFT_68869 [Naegleria gruberi]EFC43121.1 predicted protein [Naegleria gruberi]|eukprot:XP_002675865.1 predicted protein [Naegleria gruberi strain NEG-M]